MALSVAHGCVVRVSYTYTVLFVVFVRLDCFLFVWFWLHTCVCYCCGFVRETMTTLADNKVGDRGAKDLAKALKVNTSLQTLDLSGECCCCMARGCGSGG